MTPTRSDRRSTRGFTIVEVVLAVFLALIVLLAAGTMFVSTAQTFKTGTRKLQAQQEATLLSTVINRRVRVGTDLGVYVVPNRAVPADSGNGFAVRDRDGNVIHRLEWSSSLQTLVDSNGVRVTSMKLQGVQFKNLPAEPKTLRYKFKTDDEKGNLVDIESSATARN